MEINGISTKGMAHTEAIDLIKRDPTVRLLLRRRKGQTTSSFNAMLPSTSVGQCCHQTSSVIVPNLPLQQQRRRCVKRDASLDSTNRYSNPVTVADYGYCNMSGSCSNHKTDAKVFLSDFGVETDVWVKRASRKQKKSTKRVIFAKNTTLHTKSPDYCNNSNGSINSYCYGFKAPRSKSTGRF